MKEQEGNLNVLKIDLLKRQKIIDQSRERVPLDVYIELGTQSAV